MGNNDSKGDNTGPDTSKNKSLFNKLSHNKPILDKSDVQKAWNEKIDERLSKLLFQFLFSSKTGLRFADFDNFVTNVLKGSYGDKADFILELLSTHPGKEQLHELIDSVIKSAIQVEHRTGSKGITSWGEKSSSSNRLAGYCLHLAGGEKSDYTRQDIIATLPVLGALLAHVVSDLVASENAPGSFFPRWTRLKGDAGRELRTCSVLTLEDILFLNAELPIDFQSDWRLLFSTQIHGESFARLSGQIVNEGPTLVILRDKDERVFGGFAPASWSLNPNFVGDSSSFLFSLRPQINLFPASNFNDNFQYLNQGQQTLPNGLGMGGRLEYFGLWLDSEFGKGVCNDSCTTFRGFQRLSKDKEFLCADVEVWGVGQAPPSAAERGERSILDGNTEAKALLELAGKKTYSDGLREEPKD